MKTIIDLLSVLVISIAIALEKKSKDYERKYDYCEEWDNL